MTEAAPLLGPLRSKIQAKESRLKSLSDLPHEVLVVLMQHVPLQQRLVGCARLSSKFRRAAAAATTCIKHHAARMVTVYGLQAYLQAHGAVVVSFDLKPPLAPLQRLPFALQQLSCPSLLKLQLTDTLVQLTSVPGSQQPGILPSCTALTSLCLLNCNVLDPSHQLGELSVLQDLQELVVKWDADCSRRARQPLSLLPGNLLSQLVRLSSVYLSNTVRFASLEYLSCLTALQQFRVVLAADAEQETFSGVDQLRHLTSLRLDCHQSQQSIAIGLKYQPDLSKLTALKELDAWACRDFRPVVLQQMRSLQDLTIRRTSLFGDARGTSNMLQMLWLLKALTQLDLKGTLQHPAERLQDYTALACLSNLGVLVLSHCSLPAGLWQQLAETNMPMRSVWSLNIDHCTTQLLESDGLSSLVRCFPSLVGFSCVQSTQHNIQWTSLQQLHHLQALHMSGVGDADVPVLASLQRLTTLKVMGPSSITDLGLLQLTALSRLEQLHVAGNLSDGLGNGQSGHHAREITNQAPAGQMPDVAKQLMCMCFGSIACQPVLLGQLDELLHIKAVAQAVADREAKVFVRELAAADLEEQLAEKQESLSWVEARCKTMEQNQKARNQTILNRERKADADAAAAVAMLTASKAECTARGQQLDRKLNQIVAREQQLEAAEAQLSGRSQDLERRERLLKQPRREERQGQQLDRTLDQIAREQQLATTEAQLSGRSQDLERRERRLEQARREERRGQQQPYYRSAVSRQDKYDDRSYSRQDDYHRQRSNERSKR